MNSLRVAWIIVSLAVTPAWAGASAAGGDDQGPEGVLKSRGLKKSGSTYIVALEADTQKKVNEARLASRALNYALAQQDAALQGAGDRKRMVQALTQERIALNEQMVLINQRLDALGPPNGNVAATVDRNQLVAVHNQMVAAIEVVTDRINLLREQAAEPELAQKMGAELARRREAYLQAILDLRQVVDKTTGLYAELAQDDSIKTALSALGAKAKPAPRLGPSRAFEDNVKLLVKAEKSVLTEVVELKRQGGVFEVDVTFNGKTTVPLVFDTGASFTTISAALASRIGLKPQPSDRQVELHVADGGVITAQLMTIPSMRVGKFTVNNVACAVMPADRPDVPLLLGQSFHRHFTYKFTPESGRLVLSKVEPIEPQTRAVRTTAKKTKATRSSKTTAGASAPAAETDPDIVP